MDGRIELTSPWRCVLGLIALACGGGCGTPAEVGDGQALARAEAVFEIECASCHSAGLFAGMSEERVFRTLDSGVMTPLYPEMSTSERRAMARYLTSAAGTPLAGRAFCAEPAVSVQMDARARWNGWSPDAANTRFQPGDAAGLTAADLSGLELRWAFGFPEDLSSYSQPAVFGQQIFVGSNAGVVYALDAGTGCIQWRFEAGAPVRTAMRVARAGDRYAVLFGDQVGRFFAVGADTGDLIWSRRVDEHPGARVTGSPSVSGDLIFVPVASWEEYMAVMEGYPCCSFRGSVVALSVETGEQVWKTLLIEEVPVETGTSTDGRTLQGPSGSPIWSAPTVDGERGVLYVTTGNNYSDPPTGTSDAVVALDLETGAVSWTRQLTGGDIFTGCATCTDERGPDFDFGSSAILVRRPSGDLLVAGQKSGVVYGLDPDREGAVVWETRVAEGTSHGGVQWGMATDGEALYVPIADGDLVPVVEADGITRRQMEPDNGGGMVALRVADGSVRWEAPPFRECAGIPKCSPSQLAAATAIPGVVFSGAMDGHLRAYDTEDGSILWDVDTNRDYETVNGVGASGGALNGNGPVVAGGMLFVNSGYNHFGTLTGNVLLAFSVP